MKLHVLICDDNEIELKVNETYISSFAKMYNIDVVIHVCSSYTSVEKCLKEEKIDIAFLDINMGEDQQTGIEIAALVLKSNNSAVITFITGETPEITDVFKVRTFDYIQKPIKSDAFKNTFVRCVRQAMIVKKNQNLGTIVFTSDNIKRKVDYNQVVYIERVGQRCRVVLSTLEHFFVYESIKSIENRLDMTFIRVNQSVIVNINYVSSYTDRALKLKNNKEFNIGRSYLKAFKSLFYNVGNS